MSLKGQAGKRLALLSTERTGTRSVGDRAMRQACETRVTELSSKLDESQISGNGVRIEEVEKLFTATAKLGHCQKLRKSAVVVSRKFSLQPSKHMWMEVICANARRGCVKPVLQVFERRTLARAITAEEVGLVTCILGRHNRQDLIVDIVPHMLEKRIPADKEAYEEVICALAEGRRQRHAISCLQEMLRRGFKPSPRVFDSMLEMFDELDDVSCAREAIEFLLVQGTFAKTAYRTAMSMMLRRGERKLVSELREEIRRFKSDADPFECEIAALADNGLYNDAISVYNHMRDLGIAVSSGVNEAILRVHGMRGDLSYIMGVVKTTMAPITTPCADAWILAHFANQDRDGAIRCYHSIRRRFAVEPQRSTQDLLLTGLVNGPRGSLQLALAHMKRWNLGPLRPDAVTCSILVEALCQDHRVEAATEVFEGLRHRRSPPNAKMYNSLASMYFTKGNDDQGLEIYRQMQASGLRYNRQAFRDLIGYHALRGDIASAASTFSAMVSEGYAPDIDTFKLLVGRSSALLNGRQIVEQEIQEFLQNGHNHYSHVLRVLLESLRKRNWALLRGSDQKLISHTVTSRLHA